MKEGTGRASHHVDDRRLSVLLRSLPSGPCQAIVQTWQTGETTWARPARNSLGAERKARRSRAGRAEVQLKTLTPKHDVPGNETIIMLRCAGLCGFRQFERCDYSQASPHFNVS